MTASPGGRRGLRRGSSFGLTKNEGEQAEQQGSSGITPRLGGEFTNGGYAGRDDLGRRSRHEHTLRMFCRELPSARRGARLIKHRRALWRGVAEGNGVPSGVVPPLPDPMHLERTGLAASA